MRSRESSYLAHKRIWSAPHFWYSQWYHYNYNYYTLMPWGLLRHPKFHQSPGFHLWLRSMPNSCSRDPLNSVSLCFLLLVLHSLISFILPLWFIVPFRFCALFLFRFVWSPQIFEEGTSRYLSCLCCTVSILLPSLSKIIGSCCAFPILNQLCMNFLSLVWLCLHFLDTLCLASVMFVNRLLW